MCIRDSTNSVAHPVLCIITSISLEHTEILGDTIAQIAGEKAGIIKTGVPVVFDANESEAAAVIADRARELHSPCTALEKKMYRMLEFKNNFIDFSLSTAYDKAVSYTHLNRCMDRRTGGIADRYGYQESFQGDFAWNLSCSRDHDTDFLWCTWTYHQIMKYVQVERT